MDAKIICHYIDAYIRWPYMHAYIICHYIHASIRWPHVDAYGMCHYADQVFVDVTWMHILYMFILMHILDGLICMRHAYIICHHIHTCNRWPYIDAYGVCHYVDQILDGVIRMQILYAILSMHGLDGLICMRI